MKRVNVSRIDSSHGEMHIIQEETLSTEHSEYKKDSEIADIKIVQKKKQLNHHSVSRRIKNRIELKEN